MWLRYEAVECGETREKIGATIECYGIRDSISELWRLYSAIRKT